jgi:deazaflavin-dependent oxidoreductase (nitroreductase family)
MAAHAPPQPRLAFIRPFTTRIVNPIMRLFAGRLPGFAILRYRGRRSGREFRTPMNVFRDGERYVFALTYSSNVAWVKNVLAAGECEMEMRGRRIRLGDPQLVVDPNPGLVPQPIRFFLGMMRVSEFLLMRPAA